MRNYFRQVFTLVFLLCTSNVFAAQSTADVPVTSQLREKALRTVLGRDVVLPEIDEYVIGFGDFLRIQVYGEGDMGAAGLPLRILRQKSEDGLRTGRGGVKVRMDGRISLKHIGDVEAVGLTLTQLADYLKVLFATVFDDPIVTVVLEQSNSQRYTVMGKVLKPGVYFLDYPLNIVQTVARCGGFTEWANSEITVIRKNPKNNKKLFKNNTLQFDYDDFLDGRNLERNIIIKSGDIVIVH